MACEWGGGDTLRDAITESLLYLKLFKRFNSNRNLMSAYDFYRYRRKPEIEIQLNHISTRKYENTIFIILYYDYTYIALT